MENLSGPEMSHEKKTHYEHQKALCCLALTFIPHQHVCVFRSTHNEKLVVHAEGRQMGRLAVGLLCGHNTRRFSNGPGKVEGPRVPLVVASIATVIIVPGVASGKLPQRTQHRVEASIRIVAKLNQGVATCQALTQIQMTVVYSIIRTTTLRECPKVVESCRSSGGQNTVGHLSCCYVYGRMLLSPTQEAANRSDGYH